ncbi:ATP-binding protein [uncultured Anaeromusa sp.]|uniref:ATP-binding protein n=1 Tax=uncultured Anaeromusa sp. TaxID=673273 RepID=UPI0029C61385|nr:ATP-binding protein [uncultured Anaeromusa sp.]
MALNITRGIVVKAQKVVLYGPEGIGKSSFASDFPEPLFIDTEGSTNLMNVARLPRPTSWQMLINQVMEVKKTPGCCKTLIIDTIDWAEQLCTASICAMHQKKGIEDFGYGKGYVFVQEEFGRLLNLLQDVIDVGVNVVLTAHAQLRKFEQPDEAGSYDRYELKLGKKTGSQTSALVKEWADMVLFANYKTFVVTTENKKRKANGGERVLFTTHHPSWDAKNRHDLATELPLAYSSIANCIPNETAQAPAAVIHAAPEPPAKPQPPREEPQPQRSEPTAPPAAEPTPPKEEPAAKEPPQSVAQQAAAPVDSGEQIPKALQDLMTANSVSTEEIKNVVASKGYYPLDTPIANYDPAFIDGVLVGAWGQVFGSIQESRPF